ncbi:MAG: cysteine hydrolase [Desulfuromonadaceae bacterium]|nr:cysteine hydrolase [Desulfuromonadaceae bacterium]
MHIYPYLYTLSGLIVTIVFLAAAMMFRSMFMATNGKKIERYQNPRAALVVLDIQEGYSGTDGRQPVTAPPANGLIANVNRLIDFAPLAGMEVAYIRQVFSNNFFVRLHGGRRAGKVIVDRRVKLINNNDFEKNRTDAFSNRDFEQLLIHNQVNELYLTGVDAAYCVYFTALGALNRGYKVTVVTDAVASRNKMENVLKRYQRKNIGIITSGQLINRSAVQTQTIAN